MSWEIWDTDTGNMISFGNDPKQCAMLLFDILRDDPRALHWLAVGLYLDYMIRDDMLHGVRLQDFVDEQLDDVAKMELML